METVYKVLKILSDIGFIIFPLVGYVHQFIKINRLKSSEGFSKLVSFILLS